MYYPSRAEFNELARRGNLVPVYRELNADLETPVSVFLKLRGRGESFLLESVEGGEQLARYSFIGANPSRLFIVRGEEVTLRNHDSQTVGRQMGQDPLAALRAIMQQYCAVPVPGLPRFFGGAVGFLSYEMVRHFERVRTPTPTLPLRGEGEDGEGPDAIFLLADTLVAFDHVKHRALIIANASVEDHPDAAYDDAVRRIEEIAARLKRPLPREHAFGHSRGTGSLDGTSLEAAPLSGVFWSRPEGAGMPFRDVSRFLASPLAPEPQPPADGRPLQSNVTPAEFADMVRHAQEHIAAGDIFQVVLSQRFQRGTDAEAFSIYRALRRLNPSPYMFFLDFVDTQFIGSSPEVLVRMEDGVAQLNPIAGTRARGEDDREDARLEAELRADPKECAEHVMLVDLGRNDLGRVCEYGSVQVPAFMMVERYSHVMHLVSRVTGRVRAGLDAFDLLRATFPAGTVSGAPKVRAMEIIQELERAQRGPYAGAVGYFGFPTVYNSGNMDFCITIRTIVMRGQQAFIQAGAGIVADSVPEQEHQECVNKARALAEAIQMAELESPSVL